MCAAVTSAGDFAAPLGCSVLSVSVLFYTMLNTAVSNADLKIRAVLLFVAYICVRFFLLNNRRKNFIFCRLRLHCRAERERLPDLLIACENVRRPAFICFVTVPECFGDRVAVVFPAELLTVSRQIFKHLFKIRPAITGKGEVIRDFLFCAANVYIYISDFMQFHFFAPVLFCLVSALSSAGCSARQKFPRKVDPALTVSPVKLLYEKLLCCSVRRFSRELFYIVIVCHK